MPIDFLVSIVVQHMKRLGLVITSTVVLVGMLMLVRTLFFSPSNSSALLQQLNSEYTGIARNAIPAVINLTVKNSGPTENKSNFGSGVIVRSDGYALTSAHLIGTNAEIEAQLSNGRGVKAHLVAKDFPSDLALIKLDGDSFSSLSWGDSDKVEIGEQVVAIGNPYDLGQSFVPGVISARGRSPHFTGEDYEDCLQTTLPLSIGYSGGALVNIKGELLGILTVPNSTSGRLPGTSFAVSSRLARFVEESLIKNGKVSRGYLGVMIRELSPDLKKSFGLKVDRGAFVVQVTPGSPAEKAGVEPGDVVTLYDGKLVLNSNQLRLAVAQTVVGKKIPLVVDRHGNNLNLLVQMQELQTDVADQEDPDKSKLAKTSDIGGLFSGVTVEAVSNGGPGVLVTEVAPGAPSEGKLAPGDLIQEIRFKGEEAPRKVADLNAFRSVIQKARPDQPALIFIHRKKYDTYMILKNRSSD